MRPVKDLFFEEYWNIGFREYDDSDSAVNGGKKYNFDVLKATAQYWYADPFLFEKDGDLYLFVEVFDNKTEIGKIGFSKFVDGKFTEPEIVLEENFHLSYPYVFEKNGEIFMMPETHEDGCIQIYKSEDFPRKWKKHRILVEIKDAVDTVFLGDWLATSVIKNGVEMVTQIELYKTENGEAFAANPVTEANQTVRGAGKIFDLGQIKIRPAQNCSGKEYGKGLIFNQVDFDGESYSEQIYSELNTKDIEADGISVTGIHTYARSKDIEIVDIKSKRMNLRRFLWILQKKL